MRSVSFFPLQAVLYVVMSVIVYLVMIVYPIAV